MRAGYYGSSLCLWIRCKYGLGLFDWNLELWCCVSWSWLLDWLRSLDGCLACGLGRQLVHGLYNWLLRLLSAHLGRPLLHHTKSEPTNLILQFISTWNRISILFELLLLLLILFHLLLVFLLVYLSKVFEWVSGVEARRYDIFKRILCSSHIRWRLAHFFQLNKIVPVVFVEERCVLVLTARANKQVLSFANWFVISRFVPTRLRVSPTLDEILRSDIGIFILFQRLLVFIH